MRFSLRWFLFGATYVALVAAAVGTQSLSLVDFLWAVALIAGCYAVVLVFVVTGRCRAMAFGFVALAAAYFVSSHNSSRVTTRKPRTSLLSRN
jgi:hypothetical protein